MSRPRLHSDAEVLDAIRDFIQRNGMPPTIAELTRELGVGSTRTTLRYLWELERIGSIRRWPGARGIAFLDKVTIHFPESKP